MRRAWMLLFVALGWASAQPLAGSYDGAVEGRTVVVDLVVVGADLTGTLAVPGLGFTLQGVVDGPDAGYGTATSAEGTVGFEAYVQGDRLGLYLFEFDAAGAAIVESAIELLLTRRAAAPTSPLDGFRPPAAAPASDPVLATGSHATLTEGNALAFLDALEFVLGQLGYVGGIGDAERRQAVAAIAANYPAADPLDQLVLADARRIWDGVRSHWATASEAEQREFALGVLILAFGEETVRAWAGPVDAAGDGRALGTGSCGSFEDCTSSFVDGQTWSDTFNAQGCWAAAGCSSFDASTSTFTYDD
jgi:hypothetical protein